MRGQRVGERVDGRYEILRFLGAGGMGEVYEAQHLSVGKRVAMKFLLRLISADAAQLARFEREARVASLVESPHLVDVLDAGTHSDGSRYLVMELLRGVTLTTELARAGTLSGPRACEILRQVATGLGAAHSAGIIHRDLKPDNVFLVARPDGPEHVKILDFGASKYRRPDMEIDITSTGMAIGTPMYMSPEQAEGSPDVDGLTDVWACGVLLYRMLTGEHPFLGENFAKLVVAIATAKPVRLAERRPDLPAALDAIVARCLEKLPARRYGSMAELVDALAAVGSAPNDRAAVETTPTSETRPLRPPADPPASARPIRIPAPPPAPTLSRHEPLPFDEVVLAEQSGRRILTARAFFELPLSERIRHVIARTATFLLGGVEVDRQEALSKLRERRVAAS